MSGDHSTRETRLHLAASAPPATRLHARGADRCYSGAARYFRSRRRRQTTRDSGRSRCCRLAAISRTMSIEGLGKKFQEARRARNLTLDEAARMTKIRPARLAEIEAEDFSQFPSLAYAKGFLLIYGKFLDVDVTPYLDAFEDSERMTVDGYSYLQENRPEKPISAPVVRRRRPTTTSPQRISPMPLIFGVLVLVVGFSVMKLILNVRRLAPGQAESTAQVSPSASPVSSPKTGQPATTETSPSTVASAPTVAPSASVGPTVVRKAVAAAPSEPEVRKAKPVRPEDVAQAPPQTNSSPAETGE